MSKPLRIVLIIGYNLFGLIFCLGVCLFAFFSKFETTLNDVSCESVETSLSEGNYSQAMQLVGGYFNSTYIYQENFDNGGIVIFEAATLTYEEVEQDGETTEVEKLQKVYGGFIYGVKDTYSVSLLENNQTKLTVYDSSSNTYNIELLDKDTNEDSIKDNINTHSLVGFIYFEIPESIVSDINNFSFIDCNGNVFKNIIFNKNFSEAFFTDVNAFLEEYNKDYQSDKLSSLDSELRAKSDAYLMSSTSEIYTKVIKGLLKDCVLVLIIFMIVVVWAGDFIFGFNYTIKFIKWIIGKFKKNKGEEVVIDEAVFGNDFYSQVTISLDVSEINEFNLPVCVKYSNQTASLEYNLLKENNYTETKRVKAGTYVNPWLNLDNNYVAYDMPTNLKVNSYKTNITIKIVKK